MGGALARTCTSSMAAPISPVNEYDKLNKIEVWHRDT